MSLLSQFFPSGGGGSSNIGGGTIPVEILGISGGGGGGATNATGAPLTVGPTVFCATTGGGGGNGAIFYASNYYLNPGVTYPITIGAGGAGGPAPVLSPPAPTPQAWGDCNTQGSNGGFTSFNNPVCQLYVDGGGGGGAGTNPQSGSPSEVTNGLPGGTGGGGSRSSNGGCGKYYQRLARTVFMPPAGSSYVPAEVEQQPWGCRGGFCGACGSPSSTNFNGGNGGVAGGNCVPSIPAEIYQNSITGQICCYSFPGSGFAGCGGASGLIFCVGPGYPCFRNSEGSAGSAGALIIKWPSGVLGAAPPTGFPGGTNISPQTPGYNTYCFTSSGSITLP